MKVISSCGYYFLPIIFANLLQRPRSNKSDFHAFPRPSRAHKPPWILLIIIEAAALPTQFYFSLEKYLI